MKHLSYVGDRVTAASLRLAGVRAFTPDANDVEIWRAIEEARHQSALVIVDQDCAERVGTRLEDAIVENPDPPVVVLPSFAGDDRLHRGASRRARLLLGLEAEDRQ